MRYRTGEKLHQSGPPISGGVLIFAVVPGLLIGVSLFVPGWRGRQMWLTVWGGGLVFASVTYLITASLGII